MGSQGVISNMEADLSTHWHWWQKMMMMLMKTKPWISIHPEMTFYGICRVIAMGGRRRPPHLAFDFTLARWRSWGFGSEKMVTWEKWQNDGEKGLQREERWLEQEGTVTVVSSEEGSVPNRPIVIN
jgi:hypothetical protein